VKRYSSGMYVRLAFSVAAHLEPEILIVDEVLAVGDVSFQRKCLGKMTEVSKQGRTVLFVSHAMANLTRLCQRGLLLDGGRLVDDGPIETVVAQYMNRSSGGAEVRRWDDLDTAPGTEDVKLSQVSVVDDQEQPQLVATVEQRLRIKIVYTVLTPGVKFRCNVTVYMRDICAFSTMERAETTHPEAGRYEAVVEIPANYLAEGDYRLTVSMFTARSVKFRHVYVEDALVFHVYDPITGRSARGDYTENYSGVVRPMLDWRREFLGPDQERVGELGPVQAADATR
jgi:lipopolysaccharide transport system ATP-binding protein